MKKSIDFAKKSVCSLLFIIFFLEYSLCTLSNSTFSSLGRLQESRTSNGNKLEEYEETIKALQKDKEKQDREMEEMRKKHEEEVAKLKQEKEEWEMKYRKVVQTMSAKHGVGNWNSNSIITLYLLR